MKNYEKYCNRLKNDNIIFENFIFNRDNRNRDSKFWRCNDRKCTARGYINDKDEFVLNGVHNHEFEKLKITKIKTLEEIRQKAEEKPYSSISIVTNATKNLTTAEIKELPKLKSMLNKCRRIKNKHLSGFDPVFDDIPEFLQKDLNGSVFMQYDSGINSHNRYVIFYSQNLITFFDKSMNILIDGTFWSVPNNFEQLLTISFNLFGKFFPLIFVLMQKKSEIAYDEIFNKLKKLCDIKVENIIIDFELALKNAISNNFPSTNVFGCSFHYGQMIWRAIQSLGLNNAYRNDKTFKKTIKNIINLSFVPPNSVKKEYERLMNNCSEEFKILAKNFILYFTKNFIGTESTEPRYKIMFWNCHGRILKNIPRTTNCLEAWHRTLNFNCVVSHLNLGKFIEILIQENEKIRINLIQSKKFIDLAKKKLEKEEKLKVACLNFHLYEYEEFYDILYKINDWENE